MPVTNGGAARYGAGPDDAEFVARVDYVGPEPQFLSGRVPALQTVGLTVTEVRRGDVQPGQSLELDVVVVAGAPSVGIGTTGMPALDPVAIQVGAPVTARAGASGGRWMASEVRVEPAGGSYAGRAPGRR
jgi:hypothetical protein